MRRPDGVEIAWREHGDGAPVVIANIGYGDPATMVPLTEELSSDHRVLSYDTRGAGASTRTGPYDVATDADDLVAVMEDAAMSGAVALGNGDGANRAIKAAVRRPDLIGAVVVPGGLPTREAARGGEGLVASESVLQAMLMLLENDYRAGVNAIISNGNPDYDEDTIHTRVEAIVGHGDQEAMVGRLRSWIADDPIDDGRSLGERLWVLHHDANPWFTGSGGLRRLLPDAHHEEVADGPMMRPDLTAGFVRRVRQRAAR